MKPCAWTRYTFRAGADGLAHAHALDRHVQRTACDLPATDERLAHPERSRCADCLEALGFLGLGARWEREP